MRMIPLRLLLCFLALVLLTSSCHDDPGLRLRIAAWNLEHLDDSGTDGCVPREQGDYDAMAAEVKELALDIVAFQEVENEAAAHRVFPESDWYVVSVFPACREARALSVRTGRARVWVAWQRGLPSARESPITATPTCPP